MAIQILVNHSKQRIRELLMRFKQFILATGLRLLTLCCVCAAAVTVGAKAESNQVFGRILAAIPKEVDANGEIPLGDFVADAQLMATQAVNLGRAEIALVSAGSLKNNGFNAKTYPHDVRYDEILALHPHGTDLITMKLTAQQLKYVLEQQFVGCGGQNQQRILQVSSGFSFSWKGNRGPCAKIWDIKLTHMDLSHLPPIPSGVVDVIAVGGVVLNPNRTYNVTVSEFLAKGGDNFTILKDGIKPTLGVSDIDAVASYLENFKFPKPSYDPNEANLNRPRIIQLPPP